MWNGFAIIIGDTFSRVMCYIEHDNNYCGNEYYLLVSKVDCPIWK